MWKLLLEKIIAEKRKTNTCKRCRPGYGKRDVFKGRENKMTTLTKHWNWKEGNGKRFLGISPKNKKSQTV